MHRAARGSLDHAKQSTGSEAILCRHGQLMFVNAGQLRDLLMFDTPWRTRLDAAIEFCPSNAQVLASW
jgi:hypothetical protein